MVQLTQFDVAELDAMVVAFQPAAAAPMSNAFEVSKSSPGHLPECVNSAANPVPTTTD